MRVRFTNPRVAKVFEAAEGFPDRVVHIPKIYVGLISNISFAGALKMEAGKTNLLFRKKKEEEKLEEPPAQEPPATEQTETTPATD